MPLISTFGSGSARGWRRIRNMPRSINVLLVGGGGPANALTPGAGGRVTLRTNYAVGSGTYYYQVAATGGTTQLVKLSGYDIGQSISAGPGTLSGRTTSSGSDINGVVSNVSNTTADVRPAQWGSYPNYQVDQWYGSGRFVFTNHEQMISASSGVSATGNYSASNYNNGYYYGGTAYNQTNMFPSPNAPGFIKFTAAPEFDTDGSNAMGITNYAGYGAGGQGVASPVTGHAGNGAAGMARGVWDYYYGSPTYYNDSTYFNGKIWALFQTGGEWPRWFGNGQISQGGVSYDWTSYGLIAISYPSTFDKLPELNENNSYYWYDSGKHCYYLYGTGTLTI